MPSKAGRMKKPEIDAIRKKLEARRSELVRKLSEFRNESKTVETDVAQDLADKAESSYTKEFLLSLSDAERRQLAMIDESLRRLKGKEFGLCQMCGKPISKKRLSALPWTPYCIDCQQKQEQESD